jgi:hypothetical protein
LLPLAQLGQSSDVTNLLTSYVTTMHAKVTRQHISSRLQMMPFNNTSSQFPGGDMGSQP